MTRILTLTFFFGLLLHAGLVRAGDELEKAFANPPDSANAWCYWWWLNGAASTDGITADAYATTLFGLTADDIGYIRLGAEMGLGEKDWSAVKVEEIDL